MTTRSTATRKGRVPPPKGGTKFWDADLGRWRYKPHGRGAKTVDYNSAEGERARHDDGETPRPFSAKHALRRAGVAADDQVGRAARATRDAGSGLLADAAGGPGIGALIVYGAGSLLGLILLDTALRGRGPDAVGTLLGGLGQGIRKLVDPSDPIIGQGAPRATTAPATPPTASPASPGRTSPDTPAKPTSAPTHARGVELVKAIDYAKSLGLTVRENPYTGDVVDPVHVEGSYHYRTFPGSFDGKKLGRAADVSGPANVLATFFQWVKAYTPTELIYTPLGAYSLGTAYTPSASEAAAHTDHVHVAF